MSSKHSPPPSTAHTSYDPKFFARITEVEDKHFWFCARNRIIAAVARSVVGSLPSGYRVLEIGCGTGFVLRQLVEVCRGGEVIGVELFPEAVELARRRAGCQVLQGDAMNPPAGLGEFDMVCLFDVLEHLPDDRAILRSMNRLLKNRAALLITVPAHMSLWSCFDVFSCHCRRYERDDLTCKLGEAGFRVEYLTEFMMSIFPLMWFSRGVEGATQNAYKLKIIPGVNTVLKGILSLEAIAIARRWRLPKGTSFLTVARK